MTEIGPKMRFFKIYLLFNQSVRGQSDTTFGYFKPFRSYYPFFKFEFCLN